MTNFLGELAISTRPGRSEDGGRALVNALAETDGTALLVAVLRADVLGRVRLG